jgi:hypothetical protein
MQKRDGESEKDFFYRLVMETNILVIDGKVTVL